jgi:hypothetical protein
MKSGSKANQIPGVGISSGAAMASGGPGGAAVGFGLPATGPGVVGGGTGRRQPGKSTRATRVTVKSRRMGPPVHRLTASVPAKTSVHGKPYARGIKRTLILPGGERKTRFDGRRGPRSTNQVRCIDQVTWGWFSRLRFAKPLERTRIATRDLGIQLLRRGLWTGRPNGARMSLVTSLSGPELVRRHNDAGGSRGDPFMARLTPQNSRDVSEPHSLGEIGDYLQRRPASGGLSYEKA